MTLRPALALALSLVSVATTARAQGTGCDEPLARWAAACDPSLRPALCDTGLVVLAATPDDAPPLRIELRAGGPGLREIAGIAIRPAAELPDWREAPAPWQRAVESLAGCVERAPPPGLAGHDVADAREPAPPGTHRAPPPLPASPWRAALGLALAVVLMLAQRRRLRVAVPWWLALVLPVVTWLARRAITPPDFFHQNGQGPLWIDMALCQPSMYGPGQRELFQHAARLGGVAAEQGVFALQSALAALVPLAVLATARALRAGWPLALGCALVVALDPIAARVSQSESYYASCASLIALACAVAAWGTLGGRAWTRVVAALAAGLLIAQAARVHPLAWLPSAMVPGVVLLLPGAPRRRALDALAIALGIAAVVVVTSGSAMLQVVRGPLFAQWGGMGAQTFASAGVPWPWVLAALGALVLARSPARGAACALVLVASGVGVDRLGGFGEWPAAITAAATRLHLVPVALAIVAVLARTRGGARARALGTALALTITGVWLAASAPVWLARPTDVLEQRIALGWRDHDLRDGDTLVYVSRAGDRVVVLPLYECVDAPARAIELHAERGLPPLAPAGRLLYARTSLCTTPDAEPLCAELERRYTLHELHHRELPARPSLPHLPYRDARTIPISLSLATPRE